MRANAMKEKLRGGRPVVGTFCNFPSPAIAEMLGLLGLDFLIVDCEHGSMTPEAAEHMYRAAEVRGLSTVTRVGENTPQVVQKYLEAGTQGVLMPMVSTVADAQRVIDAVKYPPIGKRGLAPGRPSDYGFTDMGAYTEAANRETLVSIQIETNEGVDNIGEIVKVPHIDVVFFGPTDLSVALGIPGQSRHAEVISLIERLGRVALEAGTVVGTLARDREEYQDWRERGFLFLCTSVTNLLTGGARKYLEDLAEVEKDRA